MQRLVQSPKADDFVQNPYRFYDQARADGPIFIWEDLDNLPCLTGYQEVQAAFRDKRLGREAPPERYVPMAPHLSPFEELEAASMLELEPPRHTRLRGLVLRAFTSRRIAALGPEIEALCHQLIDDLPDTFDLIESYAKPLPVIIIARLLGVPETDRNQLLAWSNAMVAMYTPGRTRQMEDAAAEASRAFAAYISDHTNDRRKRPSDDLISALLAAEAEGERLSRAELVSTCILLLNAGHEATVHSMGNALKTLLESGTRQVDATCVEELLRFDPPLHMFLRWVYDDIDIAGRRFQRGDQIGLLLGAANRDPAAFAEPNRFDPQRMDGPNVAFGAGIHFCVGAPLARLELLIGLQTLLSRMPNLSLAQRPRYGTDFPFHGLGSLNLQR